MRRTDKATLEGAFGRVRAAVLSRALSFPEKASADSAEKNAGARGKGGCVLKRARRIVRQVRTFRTISDPPRTGGCSAGDAEVCDSEGGKLKQGTGMRDPGFW
jgi:hypothetical protein